MDDGTVARLGRAAFPRHHHHRRGGRGDGASRVLRAVPVAGARRADVSVTEQWAQVAVAGPRSRELVERRARRAGRRRGFPFMACGAGADRRGRRRGCSASRSPASTAYELAVPARYGAALFELLVERARGARRRAVRDGGAERAPDREGAADPRRAARAHHRRRPRARADGRRGQGLHRQGGRGAAGAARAGARAARRAAAARSRRRGWWRARMCSTPGAAAAAANDLGLSDLGLPFADARARHRARLRAGRPGAASGERCGRSACCAGSTSPARSCRRRSSIRTGGRLRG